MLPQQHSTQLLVRLLHGLLRPLGHPNSPPPLAGSARALFNRANPQPLLGSHGALVSLRLHVESKSEDFFSYSRVDFTIAEHRPCRTQGPPAAPSCETSATPCWAWMAASAAAEAVQVSSKQRIIYHVASNLRTLSSTLKPSLRMHLQ